MTAAAVGMFVFGAALLWGGLALAIGIALHKGRRRD